MMSQNDLQSLARRIAFSIFVAVTIIPALLTPKPASHAAFEARGGGSLKILVRDSTTGFTLPGEVVSRVKNGAGTLWTNARGQGNYQLSSGRNDLEIHAV